MENLLSLSKYLTVMKGNGYYLYIIYIILGLILMSMMESCILLILKILMKMVLLILKKTSNLMTCINLIWRITHHEKVKYITKLINK
jgi:hypothetical protein